MGERPYAIRGLTQERSESVTSSEIDDESGCGPGSQQRCAARLRRPFRLLPALLFPSCAMRAHLYKRTSARIRRRPRSFPRRGSREVQRLDSSKGALETQKNLVIAHEGAESRVPNDILHVAADDYFSPGCHCADLDLRVRHLRVTHPKCKWRGFEGDWHGNGFLHSPDSHLWGAVLLLCDR
jgi:hypothetical protein